jgi:hypothetical protein
MTRLSNDPLQPNVAGEYFGGWANFTVFVRVEPSLANGKRFEYVRNLEKIANRVEDDIRALIAVGGAGGSFGGSNGLQIGMPGPVLATPQFAQKPARLTITGFMLSGKRVLSPLTERSIDSDGQVMTGPSTTGGTINPDVAPTADQDDDVRILKAALEAASADISGNIFRIELNGVLYGDGGRSFP